MKKFLAVILISCFVLTGSAAPHNKYNLMIAPGTLSETSYHGESAAPDIA